MDIFDLGMTEELMFGAGKAITQEFTIGRVTQEHRERYIVTTGDNEYSAEVTGNLRFTAASRADYPAVGDWVAMMTYDGDSAIIHQVLPRHSLLERQAAGRIGEKQIIAANVDCAFIVQSLDNNFNINRMERYLSVCHTAGIEPVVVLSKTDLISEAEIKNASQEIDRRIKGIRYILLSNFTGDELDRVSESILKGKTYCVIGSSGVGKSTLINNLLKHEVMKTRQISLSTGKGTHTTEHRELFILDNGGIIIDTPGMKELGMTDNEEGITATFQEIHDLALQCMMPECSHRNERGCAVNDAVERGIIDRNSVENYRKMLREQERFTSTVAERRKKDRQFGKMAKEILKEKKKTKF